MTNFDQVNFSLASIPSRLKSCRDTINSIYDQADNIYIFLNGYKDIPTYLDDKKITVFRSQQFGDQGDTGKFFASNLCHGYFLTIDDDIIYPQNYAQKIKEKIDEYSRNEFICVHGNRLPSKKIESYYKDKIGIHFENDLEKDTLVDIPGTGTLGFHTSHISINLDYFPIKNMTDIWLFVYARRKHKKIICIEREARWLKQTKLPDKNNYSIYNHFHNKDFLQTFIVNNHQRFGEKYEH